MVFRTSWLNGFLLIKKTAVNVLLITVLFRETIVSYGVAQSSHLGRLLIILLINDIMLQCSRILMFVDGVKLSLAFTITSEHLKQDLKALLVWSSVNLMSTNLRQCKKLLFSRSSTSYSMLD